MPDWHVAAGAGAPNLFRRQMRSANAIVEKLAAIHHLGQLYRVARRDGRRAAAVDGQGPLGCSSGFAVATVGAATAFGAACRFARGRRMAWSAGRWSYPASPAASTPPHDGRGQQHDRLPAAGSFFYPRKMSPARNVGVCLG